jgi:hypothetical protein
MAYYLSKDVIGVKSKRNMKNICYSFAIAFKQYMYNKVSDVTKVGDSMMMEVVGNNFCGVLGKNNHVSLCLKKRCLDCSFDLSQFMRMNTRVRYKVDEKDGFKYALFVHGKCEHVGKSIRDGNG